MISRSQRIPKKLFPNSLSGRVFSNDLFSIRLVQGNPGNAPFRASVVVSKKVAKGAVARNLIRRRFYSILRSQGKKIPQGSLVVLYVRAPSMKAKFGELEEAFKKIVFV